MQTIFCGSGTGAWSLAEAAGTDGAPGLAAAVRAAGRRAGLAISRRTLGGRLGSAVTRSTYRSPTRAAGRGPAGVFKVARRMGRGLREGGRGIEWGPLSWGQTGGKKYGLDDSAIAQW